MNKQNYKEAICELEKDLKNCVEKFTEILYDTSVSVEKLKIQLAKPTSEKAALILDYMSWEEGQPKRNFEACFEEELSLTFAWLDEYIEQHGGTRESVLRGIIEKDKNS